MIRRESRLGFLFLILALCMAGAQASAWRVGMVCLTEGRVVDESLSDRLYNRVSSQFPRKNLLPEESQAISARLSSQTQLEAENLAHEALIKNDGVPPARQLASAVNPVIPGQLETLWIYPTFPESLFKAIAAQDPLVLSHLYRTHGLDQFFVAYATVFEGFTRLRIFTFESKSGQVRVLFDRIALPQETESLLDQVVMALAPGFLGGPAGAVTFSTSVTGVQISIDGLGIIPQHGYTFFSPGKHFVRAEAMGYKEFQTWIQILPGELLVVELPLELINPGPLLMVSPQGASSLWIKPDLRVSVPFLWIQPEMPFTYQVRKEGFLPISGHMYVQESVLTLHFEPEWMSLAVTLDRSKDAFYASLGRTVLAFGLTIAADSFSRAISVTVADQVAWQPFILAGAGALGVSFFDTISRLFAYYRKTQYISQ